MWNPRVNPLLRLAAIFGIGLLLRLLALVYEPPHHPDEFFQYLEPAWGRLTGASVETWEWRDGVRSWVLPGYHGAWMALLLRLGVRDGVTVATVLARALGVAQLDLGMGRLARRCAAGATPGPTGAGLGWPDG